MNSLVYFLGVYLFLIPPSVIIADEPRTFIKSLQSNLETKSDDYIQPNLISQTAVKLSHPKETITPKLRELLKKGDLKLKTRFSKSGLPPSSFKLDDIILPSETLTGGQLDGINECTVKKCLMKLHTEKEIKKLESSTAKKEMYRRLVYQRIQNYLKTGELLGYEDRASNRNQVTEMLAHYTSLSAYPKTKQALLSLLKSPDGPVSGTPPRDSWIKIELAIIAPDRMQPILRISEDFEFEENGSLLIFELPIYTNHYFDSSSTLYELMPFGADPKKSLLAVTDVMEVDELKKSGLIRALFKGTMVKAISKFQDIFIEALSESLEAVP